MQFVSVYAFSTALVTESIHIIVHYLKFVSVVNALRYYDSNPKPDHFRVQSNPL